MDARATEVSSEQPMAKLNARCDPTPTPVVREDVADRRDHHRRSGHEEATVSCRLHIPSSLPPVVTFLAPIVGPKRRKHSGARSVWIRNSPPNGQELEVAAGLLSAMIPGADEELTSSVTTRSVMALRARYAVIMYAATPEWKMNLAARMPGDCCRGMTGWPFSETLPIVSVVCVCGCCRRLDYRSRVELESKEDKTLHPTRRGRHEGHTQEHPAPGARTS